jgi:hypothetical protein
MIYREIFSEKRFGSLVANCAHSILRSHHSIKQFYRKSMSFKDVSARNEPTFLWVGRGPFSRPFGSYGTDLWTHPILFLLHKVIRSMFLLWFKIQCATFTAVCGVLYTTRCWVLVRHLFMMISIVGVLPRVKPQQSLSHPVVFAGWRSQLAA